MADIVVTLEYDDINVDETYPDGHHPTHAEMRRWFDRVADPTDALTGVVIRSVDSFDK